MSEFAPLVVAILFALVALCSGLLGRSVITLPMVCLASGYVIFRIDGVPFHLMQGGLLVLAEATLAIVLFTDAAHLKPAQLMHHSGVPARMLLIGLPLAVLIGTLMIWPVLGAVPIWQVALLAALLAPTDAALGQAVFENEEVPEDIRESLTVESGLNDGLALPFIIFLACAAVGFDHDLSQNSWVWFALKQIGFGVAVGAGIGAFGGWISHKAIDLGVARENNSANFALLLVAVAYFAAELVGGNSFVAVFVAGLLFGRFAQECADRAKRFLSENGQLLMMAAFFFIGALLLPTGLAAVNWVTVVVVGLSLFLIRPLAIFLSLAGTGLTKRTKLFFGWFGPRGLATALFSMIVLSEFEDKLQGDVIMAVVALAVVASTVLHGVSAHFAARICHEEDSATRSSGV